SPAAATWSVTVTRSILMLPTIVILGLLICLTIRDEHVLEYIPECFNIDTCCEFDVFRPVCRLQQVDDGHAVRGFTFRLDGHVDAFECEHLGVDQVHRRTCIMDRAARKAEMVL